MAQLGMLVPAKSARYVTRLLNLIVLRLTLYNSLCPVDSILTRMGAYDNMFSNASTFKVELDEWYVLGVCHVVAEMLTSLLAARSFVMLRRNHSSSSTSSDAELQHTYVLSGISSSSVN